SWPITKFLDINFTCSIIKDFSRIYYLSLFHPPKLNLSTIIPKIFTMLFKNKQLILSIKIKISTLLLISMCISMLLTTLADHLNPKKQNVLYHIKLPLPLQSSLRYPHINTAVGCEQVYLSIQNLPQWILLNHCSQ